MTATAKTKKNSHGFAIAVGCPGCGGELEMGEDFFVLTCHFCNSILRIKSPEQPPAYLVKGKVPKREVRFSIDRYLHERQQPLTSSNTQLKRIYYPYWKVDGIVLKTRNKIDVIEQVNDDGQTEYESKIKRTEVSLSPYSVTFPAGLSLDGVPYSLGLRTDYIKLEPYTEDALQEKYSPVPIVMAWPEARQEALDSVSNVGRIDAAEFGKNRTELFRPHGRLVYFPYYIAESYDGGFRRWIVDAVIGRVAGEAAKLTPGDGKQEVAVEFGQLGVDFHRCRNCGHDLPAQQSYVYVCKHCQQLSIVEPHPLYESTPRITTNPGGPEDKLLPFWALRTTDGFSGKIRSLAGGLGQSQRLVVPAFRVGNFEAAYRLARRMTTATGNLDLAEAAVPDNRFAPVSISPAEALVHARVVVARELLGLSGSLEIPQIADAFSELVLFYIPFHAEHYFYVDSVLNAVTLEKNLVPA